SEFGDLHGSIQFDTLAGSDSCQAGHRSSSRVWQPHMRGSFSLTENQIMEPIVTTTVSPFSFRQHNLFALAKAFRQVDLSFDFNRPGLAFIVANVQTPLLSIESQPVSF